MPDFPYAKTHPSDSPRWQDELPPGKKNIVICCDGTGNEFSYSNSNVVKFYTALKIDDRQVGYYHPGVGTMGDPAERYRLLRWWSEVKGLAFASGFKDNVMDAYRYLMGVYNDGDRVLLFGFSRGAYTVRALAGLLNGYGLLCRGNEGHLPYAWRLYAEKHSKRELRAISSKDPIAAAFKETYAHKNFDLHFVGLWDTVSSVGWIYSPLRLFNVSQNPSILCGRHAISIDERRCFFQDNPWGDPLEGQDIEQIWFAGVHSDVGGSYERKSCGLSLIALEWMIDEAKRAHLYFQDDRVDIVLGRSTHKEDPLQEFYGPPNAREEHYSLKGPWWILEAIPSKAYSKALGKELYRVPFGRRREIPPKALVHSTVVERIKDRKNNYTPQNLPETCLKPIPATGKPTHYEYVPTNVVKSDSLLRRFLVLLFAVIDIAIVFVLAGALIHLFIVLWHGIAWLLMEIAHLDRYVAGKILHCFKMVLHRFGIGAVRPI